MMGDPFRNSPPHVLGSFVDAFDIVPSADPLPQIVRALLSETGGSVTVIFHGKDTAVTLPILPGTPMPVRVSHVTAGPADLKGLV
ncbi:MAG: hypothetical protein AAF862_06705 [Pseudomonadota bacterium]